MHKKFIPEQIALFGADGRRNIDSVGRQGLCTECGACWGICPKHNIAKTADRNGQVNYRVADLQRCGSCTLCIRVCPGIGMDFRNLQETVNGQSADDDFSFDALGPRRGVYLGRAVDSTLHGRGASGGVTSAMLAYALEELKLDGVFVARMNSAEGTTDPLSVQLFLADNRQKLIAGQQSKYITVSMARSLRHILYEGRGKRFAFVGTGCHMHALRKAEQVIPDLKKRVALRMGIFCGHCMDQRGTRHLLDLLAIKENNVKEVAYRNGKWPGKFRVQTREGNYREIGHLTWTSYVMTLFEKWRCHFCPDPLNQFADISTGDPWLRELAYSKGQNIIIPRTGVGHNMLSDAERKGYVKYAPFSPDNVIASQHRTLYRKRVLIRIYNRMARLKKLPYPHYSFLVDYRPLEVSDYIHAITLETMRSIAAQRIMARVNLIFGRLFLYRRKKRLQKSGKWF